MNGILKIELQEKKTDPKTINFQQLEEKIFKIAQGTSEEALHLSEQNQDSLISKNVDQMEEILEALLGDYLPQDFKPDTKISNKDSIKEMAILLEEMLLLRKWDWLGPNILGIANLLGNFI